MRTALLVLAAFAPQLASAEVAQGTSSRAETKRSITTPVRNDDIGRFWAAYDAIKATPNQAEKLRLIRSKYIDAGGPALHALMRARCYSDREYLEAIEKYPRFWASVRPLTLRSNEVVKTLNRDVAALQDLYPALKPATITYAIGILRTGGTTVDEKVLIGAELGLANETVDVSELPEPLRSRLAIYFKSNPFGKNAHTNLHEYVHTQQQVTNGTLLQQSVREGAAEVIAQLVAKTRPSLPLYSFGYENDAAIKKRFLIDMDTNNYSDWLWNNSKNLFGVSDLGYYVGYRIAKAYYDAAPDKKEAVRVLMEMKYDNPAEVKAFALKTGYLSQEGGAAAAGTPGAQ